MTHLHLQMICEMTFWGLHCNLSIVSSHIVSFVACSDALPCFHWLLNQLFRNSLQFVWCFFLVIQTTCCHRLHITVTLEINLYDHKPLTHRKIHQSSVHSSKQKVNSRFCLLTTLLRNILNLKWIILAIGCRDWCRCLLGRKNDQKIVYWASVWGPCLSLFCSLQLHAYFLISEHIVCAYFHTYHLLAVMAITDASPIGKWILCSLKTCRIRG